MTPKTAPFEAHAERYDRWFEANEAAYRSELRALERLVSAEAEAVEVGVGTGRFAAPLGVEVGVDPAGEMLRRATDRGITPVKGVAEALPLAAASFDTVLVVTTVCFVDDIDRTVAEARRVLRPGGHLVIGYVDRDSPLGRRYQREKADNPFYREATFVSTADIVETLARRGFGETEFAQTLFEMPEDLAGPDRVRAGHGEGSFVGVAARRP